MFFPVVLLLTYGILPKMGEDEKAMLINYKVVEGNTIVGVVLCCVAVFFPQYIDILYIGFSFSFACYLTINTYSRLVNFEDASMGVAIVGGLAKGIAFMALPTLFITQMHFFVFGIYLLLLAFAILPTIHFNKVLDFKNVNSITARANLILVGMLTIIIIVVGGFIKWFI